MTNDELSKSERMPNDKWLSKRSAARVGDIPEMGDGVQWATLGLIGGSYFSSGRIIAASSGPDNADSVNGSMRIYRVAVE